MIPILNKINIKAFIISFSIGMLIVYLVTPYPKVVFRYPTPDNLDKITYTDNNKQCYKFNAIAVKCPSDEKKIVEHNII